jgi:hypothetical protein
VAAAGADKVAVVQALAALGRPPAVRPEQLAPADFADLARELRWPG